MAGLRRLSLARLSVFAARPDIKRMLAAVAATAALLVAPAPAAAQSAPFCQPGQAPSFQLGFASLAQQLGGLMGEPLECEHANPQNGDALQRTSTGLAFYRKATNTPTFTDGFRHWALTNLGLAYWEGASVDPPGGIVLPASSSAPMYLALGDSLAVGLGSTDPEHLGYAPRLFQFLQQAQIATGVLATPAAEGESSATFVSGGQLDRAVAVILDPDTDVRVVTLGLGGNDLLQLPIEFCASAPFSPTCQSLVSTAFASFNQNYTHILRSLRDALAAEQGGARLLVMTYYNPYSGTQTFAEPFIDIALMGFDFQVDCALNAVNPLWVGLNDLIVCAAHEYGAEVVDVYPLFYGRALELTHIARGDIHPNDEGYRLIAEAFSAALAAQ